MVSSSFWVGVEEVLNLVKEHSEKYKTPKEARTTRERLSGWAPLVGGVIFVAGEVLRQLGDVKIPFSYLAYLSLSILGLAIFIAGAMVGLVEIVRTTRRPFVEHVDRAIKALGRECELIEALERFETEVLEIARTRLQLQSTKVWVEARPTNTSAIQSWCHSRRAADWRMGL